MDSVPAASDLGLAAGTLLMHRGSRQLALVTAVKGPLIDIVFASGVKWVGVLAAQCLPAFTVMQ